MTKRARYDGNGPIPVFLPEDTHEVDPIASRKEPLQPGQLLPMETLGGNPVPAAVRDELIAREDWSEVNQADQTKKDDDKKGDS